MLTTLAQSSFYNSCHLPLSKKYDLSASVKIFHLEFFSLLQVIRQAFSFFPSLVINYSAAINSPLSHVTCSKRKRCLGKWKQF